MKLQIRKAADTITGDIGGSILIGEYFIKDISMIDGDTIAYLI